MAGEAEHVVEGELERNQFETVGRTETWAEQRTATCRIVGKTGDFSNVRPHDSMASYRNWFKGRYNGDWRIKNLEIVSPDGVTDELTMSLVKCSDLTKPYNVTWDVGMEEVQMKLINHPSVIANCNVGTLLLWHDTLPGRRVVQKDGELSFYYDSADGQGTLTKITGKWDLAYCKAITQGIETYNRYLPVITKTSYYLRLPGASYNQDNVITRGTITDFTGADAIGHYDEPELNVKGYTSKNGLWFKSADRYTTQPDGSATRTESWVFTNDPSHKWIYDDNVDGGDNGAIPIGGNGSAISLGGNGQGAIK